MIPLWAHRIAGAVASIDPRLLPEGAKFGLDGLSAMATIAALAQLLPAIASLLSIIWGLIRIWETKTVQELLGRKPGGIDDQG
jgi:hypothetical protein